MTDPFWYDDLSIIWKRERLTEFFPSKDQSIIEKFNSLVRLAMYISILLIYYHSDYRYIFILIGTCILSYYVYYNFDQKTDSLKVKSETIDLTQKNTIEEFNENESCSGPTLGNPFMNYTMYDRMNIDPKTQSAIPKLPACDSNNPDIKKQIDQTFNNDLYRDVSDVFGKMNSQRQFFTMPYTGSIPDENGDFKNWLYKSPRTCKEDQDFCLKYEDLRAKAPIFPQPYNV